jgi:Leucine-rich repeat (LRR) protein
VSLAELNLAKNHLKYLPTHFFAQLTRLKKLDLSFNSLARLPTVLGPGLGMQCLMILYLSNNRLTELPMWLLPPMPMLTSRTAPHHANNTDDTTNATTTTTNVPSTGYGASSGLKELNIAHNEFQEMPRVVREMRLVQLLDARYEGEAV